MMDSESTCYYDSMRERVRDSIEASNAKSGLDGLCYEIHKRVTITAYAALDATKFIAVSA